MIDKKECIIKALVKAVGDFLVMLAFLFFALLVMFLLAIW